MTNVVLAEIEDAEMHIPVLGAERGRVLKTGRASKDGPERWNRTVRSECAQRHGRESGASGN